MKKIGKKTILLDRSCSPLYPYSSFELELLLVRKGAKPLLRTMIHPSEIHKVQPLLEKQNVDFHFSKDRFDDLSSKFKKNALAGKHILYASKNPDLINQLKKIDSEDPFLNSDQIGTMLGYPECCTSFYNRAADMPREIFMHEMIKNSGLFNPLLNLIDPNFALIFHYPCTFDCQKSVSIARAYFNVLEKEKPVVAAKYKNFLSALFLYVPESDTYLRFGTAGKSHKDDPESFNSVLICPSSRAGKQRVSNILEKYSAIIKAIDTSSTFELNNNNMHFSNSSCATVLTLENESPFFIMDFRS